MTGRQSPWLKRQPSRWMLLVLFALPTVIVPTVRAQSTASGPQQILELFGMDESTLRQFIDGRRLESSELEPLYRLLYLFPRFERVDLIRWRTPVETGIQIADDPQMARGEVFRIRGWVTDVETMPLPAESADRFGYDKFYKLRLKLTSGGRSVVVCCRELPEAWLLPAARDVELPASCDAIFVKIGPGDPGAEELVFATDHVAWHPFEPNTALGVTPGKALLGEGGMDVSLFDHLEQAKPIGHSDRDCFYQMLWTLGRLDPAAVRRIADDQFDIAQLLKQPQEEAGRFYELHGVARRALRVQVDDPDIREQWGIDHYYEVDVFLALPRTLKLVDPRDGQSRQYQTYPVTFCVRELPEGMPQGSSIRQEVSICGGYLKLWSYQSRFVTGTRSSPDGPRRRQVSPLLIASTVQPLRPAQQRTAWPEIALVVGFLLALIVIAISGWYYARSDRQFAIWRHRRPDRLPEDLV